MPTRRLYPFYKSTLINVAQTALLTMRTACNGEPIGLSKIEALGFLNELQQNINHRIAQMRGIVYAADEADPDFVERSTELIDQLRTSISNDDEEE